MRFGVFVAVSAELEDLLNMDASVPLDAPTNTASYRRRRQNSETSCVLWASGCQLVLREQEDADVCVAVEGVASLLCGLKWLMLGPSVRLARTPSCASGCCKRREIGDKLSKESIRLREEKRTEDGSDGLSRNVGKKLPPLAAQ